MSGEKDVLSDNTKSMNHRDNYNVRKILWEKTGGGNLTLQAAAALWERVPEAKAILETAGLNEADVTNIFSGVNANAATGQVNAKKLKNLNAALGKIADEETKKMLIGYCADMLNPNLKFGITDKEKVAIGTILSNAAVIVSQANTGTLNTAAVISAVTLGVDNAANDIVRENDQNGKPLSDEAKTRLGSSKTPEVYFEVKAADEVVKTARTNAFNDAKKALKGELDKAEPLLIADKNVSIAETKLDSKAIADGNLDIKTNGKQVKSQTAESISLKQTTEKALDVSTYKVILSAANKVSSQDVATYNHTVGFKNKTEALALAKDVRSVFTVAENGIVSVNLTVLNNNVATEYAKAAATESSAEKEKALKHQAERKTLLEDISKKTAAQLNYDLMNDINAAAQAFTPERVGVEGKLPPKYLTDELKAAVKRDDIFRAVKDIMLDGAESTASQTRAARLFRKEEKEKYGFTAEEVSDIRYDLMKLQADLVKNKSDVKLKIGTADFDGDGTAGSYIVIEGGTSDPDIAKRVAKLNERLSKFESAAAGNIFGEGAMGLAVRNINGIGEATLGKIIVGNGKHQKEDVVRTTPGK